MKHRKYRKISNKLRDRVQITSAPIEYQEIVPMLEQSLSQHKNYSFEVNQSFLSEQIRENKLKRISGIVDSTLGATSGAVIGAGASTGIGVVMGSTMLPVIGTIVGAVAGAYAGCLIHSLFDTVSRDVADNLDSPSNTQDL